MFTFITNIPISRRLLYAFLLATMIPCVVIFALGATFINVQNVQGQIVQANLQLLKATTAINEALESLSGGLNRTYQSQYSAGGTSTVITPQSVRSLEGQLDTLLKTYQQQDQLTTSPQMKSIYTSLLNSDAATTLPRSQQNLFNQAHTTLWPDYKAAQDKVLLALANKLTRDQSSPLLQQANQKYQLLQQSWTQIQQLVTQVSDGLAQSEPLQTYPVILITALAITGTILLIALIGYLVYLTITRPLGQLSMLTTRIARGETNARANIAGRDEIYIVANSMNNMLDNIVRLIQETQSQRDTLQAQVEKLVSEVSGVGEGDLRVQAEVTADALGVLADSFNYMVEELGSLVVRVKVVANEVENSTSAILDRMTQLVETGDTQINQIAEAVIEVEHMTASNHQVAERSQVLYDVARVARQDAQVGREAVIQTIEGMGRINENVHTTAGKVQTLGERSREINEIVDAISSIAHQTNRLALDAAIQAAMAGEHGKGFGAVAADIRRLAERAKDQAGMIARIVRSVREEIGAVAVSMQDTERESSGGARLTQEAGVALESIFAAVEHQAREIENINQMAVQQLQSSSSVVQIMHGVSQSMQHNSVSTRDASQNMERLARLVEQLRSSVEAFKLRDNQSHTSTTSAGKRLDHTGESPLTVSGVFRTVTATALPSPAANTPASSTTAAQIEDPFALYPATPYNEGSWSSPFLAEEPWAAYSERTGQSIKN